MSARRACCWIRPGFEGTALTGPKSKREPGRPLWGLAPPEASLERCSAPSVRSGPVILYPLTDQTLAGVSVLFSVCYGPGQVCPAFRFSPVWTRWVQLFGSSWVSLSGLRLFGPGGSSCQVFACLYQVGPALRSSLIMDQVGPALRSVHIMDQVGPALRSSLIMDQVGSALRSSPVWTRWVQLLDLRLLWTRWVQLLDLCILWTRWVQLLDLCILWTRWVQLLDLRLLWTRWVQLSDLRLFRPGGSSS